MREPEIVVIGAGIAGLTAAFCLQQAGKKLVVLEGAGRSGGRVHSFSGNDTNSVRFDGGPTWVWPRWQPHVQRWLGDLSVQSFAQFETGDAILDGFGPQVTRQPLPGQDGIARLSGGPTSIVEALEQRLERGTVRLDSEVVAIETKENDLRLHLRDGAVARCATAILATPLRIAVERIRIDALDPRLSGVMRQTPTWMAQQAKAVILFKTPFWRDRGLSGRVASRLGPLVEIHDHSPKNAELGALFGFVGWTAKDRQQDPETLEAEIREQLVRCFGPDAANTEQVILQDWAMEPLICSKADIAEPPEHPDVGPDLLRQGHLDDRLWFAVSETSEVSPGLIEGAFVAGQTAAQRILSKRQ